MGMSQFIPFSRDQAFLPPPVAKDGLPTDEVAHFVVAAVDRVPLGAFAVRPIPGGRAQYHPRLMLALLIYSYANGIFSSRRIEWATHRDIGVGYTAANLHPDYDTIPTFRPPTARPSRRPSCRCCCQHFVAWSAGVGGLRPTLIWAHVRRTYSGRPSSSMRFSTSTAMLISAF